MGEAKRKRGARQKQGAPQQPVRDRSSMLTPASCPKPARRRLRRARGCTRMWMAAIGAAGLPAAGRSAVPGLPRVFTTTVLCSGSGRTAPVSI
jgi:hypothetical protein